ncbi:hypothetical protein LFL96_21040 [Paraburkholderia sp. D15]|uniref:hypothetical protein n=1 Tax=Paraburkholderia sp. D15 TaxID=2880218 RepID=UPI002479D629|nr:hypothetical protein [Paraburkholderia sp. D15]WGS53547.1 hypothetical protein LFL96_21040 [Paraburkholderia sp. D15]
MKYEDAKKICADAFAAVRRQGTKDVERAIAMRASNDKELMQALCVVAAHTASAQR